MEMTLLGLGSCYCLILLKYNSKGFKIHQLRPRKTEVWGLLFLSGNKPRKKKKLRHGVAKEESVELSVEFSMEVVVERAMEEVVEQTAEEVVVAEDLAVEVEDAGEVVEVVEKLIRSSNIDNYFVMENIHSSIIVHFLLLCSTLHKFFPSQTFSVSGSCDPS